MSRIDRLIEQLCPDGVEYKALGTIAKYGRDRIPASEVGDGCYVGVNELLQEYRGRGYGVHYPAEERCIAFHPGDVLLGNIRPYLKKMWLADCEGGTNGDVLVIRVNDATEIAPEFLWQVLAGGSFTEYNIQHSKGAKMPRGDKKAILDAMIPVPPIEVQQEIVRVLDSFAELETELEAELEARNQQYAYYRDRLFADCDSIEWVGLLDLAKDCDRARKPIKQEDRIPGDTPYYGASGIVDHVDGFTHEGDYLLVSEDGANLVARTYPIAFQIHGRNWVNNHAHVLQIDNEQERKLVEIYLNSISLEPYISKGAQPKLTKKKLGDIKVPVPSEADLARIVGILEQFDVLTTDISQGLPAEIEARRKQYAYYRDKLLTFKEKVA